MNARRLFLGMLAGNAAGGLVCLLAYGLTLLAKGNAVIVIYPSIFLVPFTIGLVAAWVWRPLALRIGETLLHSLTCMLVGLTAAYVVFHEGAVCLVIGAPIIYLGIIAGALGGRVWFRKAPDRLNLCLAPLLVLAVAGEPALRGPHTGVVTDEIRIAAPPARVWPHVLAFPKIPEAPGYWLFRVGLPYPMETTNSGNFVGADRACIFSGGAVFQEKVAELVPGKVLTFDIVAAPPDPELLGHLDAHRGQFELRDNGDGTTTLIGRTWYSLHVRPAPYFDWWTHDIFRAVHLRVMKHIQHLAESESGA
ncbi:MAG: SRPBCC family protein [Chthoniobacter sp.]|uniref:SRPBCC family protein n=1 Tax=Chthoniobacter sp. TaxID=2510640 RepID=UPI0032A3B214